MTIKIDEIEHVDADLDIDIFDVDIFPASGSQSLKWEDSLCFCIFLWWLLITNKELLICTNGNDFGIQDVVKDMFRRMIHNKFNNIGILFRHVLKVSTKDLALAVEIVDLALYKERTYVTNFIFNKYLPSQAVILIFACKLLVLESLENDLDRFSWFRKHRLNRDPRSNFTIVG